MGASPPPWGRGLKQCLCLWGSRQHRRPPVGAWIETFWCGIDIDAVLGRPPVTTHFSKFLGHVREGVELGVISLVYQNRVTIRN